MYELKIPVKKIMLMNNSAQKCFCCHLQQFQDNIQILLEVVMQVRSYSSLITGRQWIGIDIFKATIQVHWREKA